MGKHLEALKSGKDPITVVIDADSEVASYAKTLNDTIVYAFRYALGRSSYSVSDACEAISRHKNDIDQRTLALIKKEINEYLSDAPIGFTTEWKDLLKELNNDPKSYSASTLEVVK